MQLENCWVGFIRALLAIPPDNRHSLQGLSPLQRMAVLGQTIIFRSSEKGKLVTMIHDLALGCFIALRLNVRWSHLVGRRTDCFVSWDEPQSCRLNIVRSFESQIGSRELSLARRWILSPGLNSGPWSTWNQGLMYWCLWSPLDLCSSTEQQYTAP